MTGRIDVPALLAAVDLVAVVGHYVPLTKRGTEYVGRCVWHSPDEHPSMAVIPAKGIVWCHACGSGGDVIAFLRQHLGLSFVEACSHINGGAPVWKPQISESAAERARRKRSLLPWITSMPPEGPVPAMATRELGKPVEVRAIRALDGALMGYECRYARDAQGKSASRVWTWGRLGTGVPEWRCRVFNRDRPLYGLDRLTALPAASVMVCEGPKKADAAGRLLPTYACVSWTGGANSWHCHDWEPLRGRTVLVWPDADAVGIEAGGKVAAHLTLGMGCVVRVLDPRGQPAGWDAADALAEGWTTERLRAWSRGRVSVWRPVLP